MAPRGLIVGVDISIDPMRNIGAAGQHDEVFRQHLRHWSLLWDRIAIPLNGNAIGRRAPDVDFLAEQQFATYLQVEHDGGEQARTTHEVFLAAVYHLEQQEPGTWACHLGPGSLNITGGFYPKNHVIEQRGVLVQLTNVIPVPDKTVPLADILNFKEKRRAELLALRHHIEEIYQNISGSADPALALNTGLESLTQSANDYLKSMRESRMPFRFATDFASINLVPGILAASASHAAHAPLATMLANVAAASITVSAGFEWARRKKAGSPFRYVARYHDELFD